MRITAKIATAGVAGLSRFPVPNATIDECLTPDGRLDESKARAALNVDQIRFSSTDTRRTVAFTMEYLKQIRSVVEHLAASLGPDASVDDERGYRTEAQTAGDRRCERNMRRNRVAYVRTDVTDCLDGIHVKLTVANPRETVGNAESFAHDYAVMCARVLNYLKDNITTTRIVLIEGEGAAAGRAVRPAQAARGVREPPQRLLLAVQARLPAVPQRQMQRPDKGGSMNCDYCEERVGCSLRKKHGDGTAVFSCGIDLGRDKSETMVYESRNGRFVARYVLPDDPHLRSYRDWFDEEFNKRLSKFFAKRVKETEADIFAWIKRNPICYMNPCRAILDGICGVTTPAIYPRDNVLAERYDISEFFIKFPLGLPIELKGIAV